MFQTGQDNEFINNISGSELVDRTNSHWRLLFLLLIGIGGFVVWAYHFEIEEVTRGPGRVIPSSQVQIVQSLEGGIVRSIDVSEGLENCERLLSVPHGESVDQESYHIQN